MAATSGFWNRIANKYARDPVADEASYQLKLEQTRRYFRPDMEVLEVGCGTGSTAIAHAPHVKSIDAFDFSEKMLDIARGKTEAAGISNIAYRQGDVETMQLPDARYDVAMAHSLLHLVADRDVVLKKLYRTLKPGGWLVTSTACIGDIAPVIGWAATLLSPLGLLPQLRVFREADLVKSIGDAGFVIDRHWRPGPKKAVFITGRKPE